MNFLGWVDYDENYERAARDAVASLRGRDAREELGVGGLRDTLADLFFPGTSTIQRRLRYFLFVAWCCECALRDRGRRSALSSLRIKEEKLIQALTPLGEGEGVIGLQRGSDLVTMPSAIYWSGLRVLDILTIRGSIGRWARLGEEGRRSDETPREDAWQVARVAGFSEDLPAMPKGFPEIESLTFQLTADERDYLRRRLANAAVATDGWGLQHNLFAQFGGVPVPMNVRFPWQHPRVATLPAETRRLLDFAEALSVVMYGATLLYNYLLCVRRKADGATDADSHMARYVTLLTRWAPTLKPAQCELVATGVLDMAEVAPRLRHGVDHSTISFVISWAKFARTPAKILTNKDAHELIKAREISLKARLGTSRFANKAARARWKYESGGRLDYRWTIARVYLNDMAPKTHAGA
jgi:hypothetical protein